MENTNTNDKMNKYLWIGLTIFVVVLFGTIAIVKNWDHSNETYFKVGDHNITTLEYTYYYNDAYSSYVSSYGSYLSYFGLDTSKPLDEQKYDGELTWNDYFMQQAVTNIQSVYAMYDTAMKTEGFDSDIQEELDAQMETLASGLTANKMTVESYLQSAYGKAMTVEKYKEFAERQLVASKYYTYLQDEYEPSQEELDKYYEENKATFTLGTFKAETMKYTYESDATDKQKETAVNEAKEKAEKQLEDMSKVELVKNYNVGSLNSVIKDWMMDEKRKEGDKAVLEDKTNKCFYAIEFVAVEKNVYGTVDCRQILFSSSDKVSSETAHKKAEMTLEFWKESNSGEEGFMELADETSDDSRTGGLYTDIYYGYMLNDINDWLYDEARKAGDTTIVDSTNGSHILYFVEKDDEPYWIYASRKAVKATKANEQQVEIAESLEIVDVNKKLTYLGRKTDAELKATNTDAEK